MSCYSFMENTKLSLTTRNAQNIFADCSIFIKMPIKLENCRLYNHNTLKITAKNIQTVYYRQNRKRSNNNTMPFSVPAVHRGGPKGGNCQFWLQLWIRLTNANFTTCTMDSLQQFCVMLKPFTSWIFNRLKNQPISTTFANFLCLFIIILKPFSARIAPNPTVLKNTSRR